MTNFNAKGVNNRFSPFVIIILLLTLTTVSRVVNGAELFPFDSHTSILEEADDEEHAVNLTNPLLVAGEWYDTLYVTSNGIISFKEYEYIFATFHADNPIISGMAMDSVVSNISAVWVKETTDETQEFTDEIRVHDNDFDADWAVVVTWENLVGFGNGLDEQNTFQVVLAQDGTREKSYAIFSYNKTEWFTQALQAGFNVGSGGAVRRLPGVEKYYDQIYYIYQFYDDIQSSFDVPERFVIDIGSAPYCPAGWRTNNNGQACLKFIRRKKTFDGARRHCQNLGGDLITRIHGGQQRTEIMRWIRAKIHIWIGVHDPYEMGRFVYINENPVYGRSQYKNGRSSTTPGNRRCVSLKLRKWYNRNCGDKLFILCERNML